MRTSIFRLGQSKQRGVTLIELIVFVVVISIGLLALVGAFTQYLSASVDPIVQIRALECAQAKMDEITARKFDENTPTGGIPACGSAEPGAPACAGIAPDGDFDDVGDYNGQVDNSNPDCSIAVTVVDAGGDVGVPGNQARRIEVDVTSPGGGRALLTSYRTNF